MMELDIADIMDSDGEKEEDNEELDAFVDESEREEEEETMNVEVEENTKEKVEMRQNILRTQRLKIAKQGRISDEKKSSTEHSLAKDGIPGNQDEWLKLNLARSIMAKRYRKTYDNIRRKKTKKNKHQEYLEMKRQRNEGEKIATGGKRRSSGKTQKEQKQKRFLNQGKNAKKRKRKRN